MDYRHTQSSYVAATATVVFLGAVGVTITVTEGSPYWYWLVVIVLAVVMIGFTRLTVAVEHDAVEVWFTFGRPRRILRMNEVTAVRTVRNKWYLGWGIRKIWGGWMYNVYGLDAVEIDLADGRKFRIGTDDPERLMAAIRLNMTAGS